MELSIKRNDAFDFLCASCKMSPSQMEKYIFTRIKAEFPKFGDQKDIGWSIKAWFFNAGYNLDEIIMLILPREKKNAEVREILDSIFFWSEQHNNRHGYE